MFYCFNDFHAKKEYHAIFTCQMQTVETRFGFKYSKQKSKLLFKVDNSNVCLKKSFVRKADN